MGLCFSGGGIRSATFNLGILQGLAELNLLRCFDYLSTVSGGGYIHQWFAAWSLRRGFDQVEKRLIPLPEPDNPGDHPEPIRWLRRYSNYLTPENGLLSGDTWVAIATWLRNTILNQAILFSGLIFVALILRFLASSSIVPQRRPAVLVCLGAIVYLMLLATFLIGANLLRFSQITAGEKVGFGQEQVNQWIVFPFTISALLLTLLLPFMRNDSFELNCAIATLVSGCLLLILALTVAMAGGAQLCYLKTHQQTAQYASVSEFWKQSKHADHRSFVLVTLGVCSLCVVSAAAAAGWIGASVVLLSKLQSVSGAYWWRTVLVVGPPLMLGGPLVALLLVIGMLGRMFDDSRREWLTRLAGCIGLFALLWIVSLSFSLFGHHVVLWLWGKLWAGIPALSELGCRFRWWFACREKLQIDRRGKRRTTSLQRARNGSDSRPLRIHCWSLAFGLSAGRSVVSPGRSRRPIRASRLLPRTAGNLLALRLESRHQRILFACLLSKPSGPLLFGSVEYSAPSQPVHRIR